MVQGMAETFDIGLAGSGATLTASNLTTWDHLGRIESHALGSPGCDCGVDGDHGAGHPPRLHAEQGPYADRVAADRR